MVGEEDTRGRTGLNRVVKKRCASSSSVARPIIPTKLIANEIATPSDS
jgi:hypothetical protein